MEKVLLIDGNNILFRSYYATAYTGNTMKNSKGFPTNALYGLVNMMNKIIEEEKPTYIMCAFDKGRTFRHEKYSDYKGGRSATPDELKAQAPKARELVEAMGITYYEIDNYEADDIIGTFAKKCNNNNDYDAVIISSDKDLLQLITDEVEVKLLKSGGESIRMTHQEFINTYGIEPPRMVDLKSLMGDSSDNIPGVKGIGEKTALNLLQEYKTLDNIYENIENIKGKLQEKLKDGKESAYQSYDLATIYTEVPIDTDFEKIKYKGYDTLKYLELLEEFEFYSLIKKLNIRKEDTKEEIKKEKNNLDVKVIDDIKDLKLNGDYSIYLELLGYNYHDAKALGFSIYDGKNCYYIRSDVAFDNPEIIFENEYNKYTYDLKKLLVVLMKNNLTINNCNYDLMIAGYLLNQNVKDDISYLMKNNGTDVMFYEEEFGSVTKINIPDEKVLIENACKKAKFIYDTKDFYLESLEKEEESYLFNEIEMPLVKVLADMEHTGINVSREYLEKMGAEITEKLSSLEKEIYDLAGCSFNIMSPKQLGEILFVKMELPYPKKIKDSSYSTSKEILDKVAPYSPIIEKILDYRTLAKLNNNYVIGLINEIKSDGKIHTLFNQTLTRTGRLSSSEPNLQNIPARLEYGKLIRKAFYPEKDSIILSSDYSQIELRVFAAMSNAENLIEAFKNGNDIHQKTASDIFGVPLESVTKDQRRQAKAVNFGILYGISSFGLSEDLNIDVYKAKQFIDDYLKTYPRISEYMKETIDEAHKNGYVKTLMNRKRIIEELNNKNYMIRSSGERMALNTPIQGTSADILKKAMVEIYNEFEKRNLKSKMLIQVHDELVFNVLKSEEEVVTNIVKDIMENTYKLSVPLVVDINKGTDWYDAK
ncbi:MAG: DNA polymerase I [Bacilli bacterium]|nr:DNA polymerase I [Bacilli bacterium]